jgi:hypothetical protein
VEPRLIDVDEPIARIAKRIRNFRAKPGGLLFCRPARRFFTQSRSDCSQARHIITLQGACPLSALLRDL